MIGSRIKRLRMLKGYSINELSEKAAVSKSYLSYIERGIQKNPSLHILSRIAKSLNISVEELLEGTQAQEPVDMESIDEGWVNLIYEAMDHGITKEEFSHYLEFIKFQKMKKDQ
jgi:XRE family transcriptional regulator, master regulator for biofilm formation